MRGMEFTVNQYDDSNEVIDAFKSALEKLGLEVNVEYGDDTAVVEIVINENS